MPADPTFSNPGSLAVKTYFVQGKHGGHVGDPVQLRDWEAALLCQVHPRRPRQGA